MNYMTALNPDAQGAELLRKAAAEKEPINDGWVSDEGLDIASAEKLSRALATALVTVTRGPAATTVRRALQSDPGNGLRVWQVLSQWHRPRTAMEASSSMARIIEPTRQRSSTTSTAPWRSGS